MRYQVRSQRVMRQRRNYLLWITAVVFANSLVACGDSSSVPNEPEKNKVSSAVDQAAQVSCDANVFALNVVNNSTFLLDEEDGESFVLVDIADNLVGSPLTSHDIECVGEKVFEISESVMTFPAIMEFVVITNYDEYDAAGALIVMASAKLTQNGVVEISFSDD